MKQDTRCLFVTTNDGRSVCVANHIHTKADMLIAVGTIKKQQGRKGSLCTCEHLFSSHGSHKYRGGHCRELIGKYKFCPCTGYTKAGAAEEEEPRRSKTGRRSPTFRYCTCSHMESVHSHNGKPGPCRSFEALSARRRCTCQGFVFSKIK